MATHRGGDLDFVRRFFAVDDRDVTIVIGAEDDGLFHRVRERDEARVRDGAQIHSLANAVT